MSNSSEQSSPELDCTSRQEYFSLKKPYAIRFRELVADLSKQHGNKKRDYGDSFGERQYEIERYGQEIEPD